MKNIILNKNNYEVKNILTSCKITFSSIFTAYQNALHAHYFLDRGIRYTEFICEYSTEASLD